MSFFIEGLFAIEVLTFHFFGLRFAWFLFGPSRSSFSGCLFGLEVALIFRVGIVGQPT